MARWTESHADERRILTDIGISIIKVGNDLADPPRAALNDATLFETRHRTLWMLYVMDIGVAAHGRHRRILDSDLHRIPLPADEAAWTSFGGHAGEREFEEARLAALLGRDRKRVGPSSARATGVGRFVSSSHGKRFEIESGVTGEFGHLLRAMNIFYNILSLTNGGGQGFEDAGAVSIAEHEDSLNVSAAARRFALVLANLAADPSLARCKGLGCFSSTSLAFYGAQLDDCLLETTFASLSPQHDRIHLCIHAYLDTKLNVLPSRGSGTERSGRCGHYLEAISVNRESADHLGACPCRDQNHAQL